MILKTMLYSSCTAKKEVLDWYQNQEKNLYIIGGSQILKLFSDQLEELIQTMIHATIDGDTLAPKFEENRYERVRQVHHPKDEKNPYDFTVNYYKEKGFRLMERKCLWFFYSCLVCHLYDLCLTNFS